MTKNNEIFYQELRRNSALVSEKLADDSSLVSKLTQAAETLLYLLEQSRKEGLLWLEDAVSQEPISTGESNTTNPAQIAGNLKAAGTTLTTEDPEAAPKKSISDLILGNELKRMVMLVVDGTDMETVEDISMKRYFTRNYSGIEGFLFLFYLDGTLSIQAGETPYVFREQIYGIMPDQVNQELSKILEEKRAESLKEKEDKWERLFLSPPAVEINSYIIRILDFCFASMDDKDLQRVLRDVDSWNLAVSMKLLGGKAYKKLHNSLSERLRGLLIEDMESMGPVRLKDIEDTDSKIFQIILKLGEMKEITVPGNLNQVFRVFDNDAISNEDNTDNEIKKFFMGMTHRDVQRVLRDIPQETLAMAMKEWDQELRRLIYGNLPRMSAGIVTSHMERVNYSDTQIREANQMVAETIRRLEDCNEVSIRG